MTDLHDQPQYDDISVVLRLQVAVDQLLQPEQYQLDRDRAAARQQLADANEQHRGHMRLIAWRMRDALAHGRPETFERLRCAMHQAGVAHRARLADLRRRLTPDVVALPSLLDRLHDAVTSTSGAGSGGRGVHRSPLGTDAVELLAAIRTRLGAHAHHRDLTDALQDWRPTDPTAADHAERWVIDARAIVAPARWAELARPCPACGERWVWTEQDGGGRTRQPAIRVNLTEGYAACSAASCVAWWPRDRFDLLAAALQQDDEDATG